MRADLQRLMADRGIGAVLVPLHELHHPSFRWITRGAKITRGYALQLPAGEPILVHYPMERDEAAATGLPTVSIHEFDYSEIFRAEPNLGKAYALFFQRIFQHYAVHGLIAICGQVPAHIYLEAAEALERLGRKVYRPGGEDLIQQARKRKERWEIERIADVGRRTELVVEDVRSILRQAEIRDGLAWLDGEPLLVGTLKQAVTAGITRHGMVEDHETILSHGRDAGIPHSRGDGAMQVRAGVPIVIDIFPSDRDSGYFFDLTRTFCIGQVPARLREIYDHVRAAFDLASSKMHAGTRASEYQAMTCDYFESHGIATTRRTPQTLDGYVHSLGHGVGLEVHEKPSFSLLDSNGDLVEPGDVLTIEPGLYFPDEEIGVRIEDTLYIDDDGRAVTMAHSSVDLEP